MLLVLLNSRGMDVWWGGGRGGGGGGGGGGGDGEFDFASGRGAGGAMDFLSGSAIFGAVVWALGLYYASPVSVVMLFLGRTDSERPSDWLLRKATGTAQMEDASSASKALIACWWRKHRYSFK